jgi:hypothetical protein
VDITGNFFGEPKGNANYQPPPELAEFLAKGEPPIFIGFGSMVIEDTAALVKTVQSNLYFYLLALERTVCTQCNLSAACSLARHVTV